MLRPRSRLRGRRRRRRGRASRGRASAAPPGQASAPARRAAVARAPRAGGSPPARARPLAPRAGVAGEVDLGRALGPRLEVARLPLALGQRVQQRPLVPLDLRQVRRPPRPRRRRRPGSQGERRHRRPPEPLALVGLFDDDQVRLVTGRAVVKVLLGLAAKGHLPVAAPPAVACGLLLGLLHPQEHLHVLLQVPREPRLTRAALLRPLTIAFTIGQRPVSRQPRLRRRPGRRELPEVELRREGELEGRLQAGLGDRRRPRLGRDARRGGQLKLQLAERQWRLLRFRLWALRRRRGRVRVRRRRAAMEAELVLEAELAEE